MSAPPGPVFTGAIDTTRKVEDLKAICTALDLDSKGLKKPAILSLLQAHLFIDYRSWEEDARFAPLYEYRKKNPPKAPRAPGGSKPNKSSAGKMADDVAEKSKPQKPLTGANLKLHEQKVTMDPPPSFGPLSSKPKSKAADKMSVAEDQDNDLDLSSLSSKTSPVPSIHDEKGNEKGGEDNDLETGFPKDYYTEEPGFQ
ncbi:hypothetical protein DFH07DRAFT_785592 [Mycena maculata]|uniref:Uncharacterized protein n=1 Tax=Mycena maculata TaxID=230809 RepID=A0AAD7H9C1_9AGAR|nr:hypothetical protein DFH07DRAFT_785592 [Mycena maculata]